MKKLNKYIIIIRNSIERQVDLNYKILIDLNLDCNLQKWLEFTIRKLEKEILINNNIK